MGRLSALAAAAAAAGLAVLGCEDGRGHPAAGLKRSEAVLASGPAAPAAVDAAPRAAAPRAPRTLCPGPPLGRAFPPGHLAQVAAAGAAALPERLPTPGKWNWISLWAAWCGPCKEEAPRLVRWQRDLGLDLHFVSLDDDRRQLVRELDAPPVPALNRSYWLPEGGGRDAWLKALNLKTEPTLPVQILVAPSGKVHCVIEGAVDDGDRAQVAAIVRGR
ncbi:MAG TPA: thioredoxin domain-containing protein [Polyangia bacterium]|jgi:thiol-disulfide isomerase/thioredoxin